MHLKLVILCLVINDQYVANTPGQLLSGYGTEAPHNQFHGGTLFHDAATGIIWAETHVSLGAGETLMAKECFGQWLWELAAVEFSILNSFWNIVRTRCRLSHFLELALIIRMPLLSSKPFCIWLGSLWFMFLGTGASLVLIILHFGILL